jgi:hypothetical protein
VPAFQLRHSRNGAQKQLESLQKGIEEEAAQIATWPWYVSHGSTWDNISTMAINLFHTISSYKFTSIGTIIGISVATIIITIYV